jgi:hypothetical protein
MIDIVMGIVALVGISAATVVALRVVSRLDRERSRRALQPYVQLRGWMEVAPGQASSRPSGRSQWMRTFGGHASVSIAGAWKGLRAELAMTRVYRNRRATAVYLACDGGVGGRGSVSLLARDDLANRYYPRDDRSAGAEAVWTAEFNRLFRPQGSARDLSTIFVSDIERDLLSFPRRLSSVHFDGSIVTVTWLEFERDPLVIDAALDIAASICLRARTPSP